MAGTKEKKCYDGYLVDKLDPVVLLMPFIMPRKTDSEVMIELKLGLDKVERFIREQRRNGIPELCLFHFVFAALVRAASVTPQINRFICGNRIYERRHVRISMIVKKRLALDGKESTIFPVFEKTDTLAQVVDKITRETQEAFRDRESDSNGFDRLTSLLDHMPAWVLRIFIKSMMFLDRHGKLPKALVDLQPFHSGFFLTNVGSIGLPVLYHHLYEFGTTSCFVAMGSKENQVTVLPGGRVSVKKVLPLSIVLDSRICDGFTYSCAFKTLRRCFEHPEWLLEPYREESGCTQKPEKAAGL